MGILSFGTGAAAALKGASGGRSWVDGAGSLDQGPIGVESRALGAVAGPSSA